MLEGVMIRGRRHVAVAVRRPNGGIAVQCRPLSVWLTGRIRRFPLARGVFILAETMILGMRALSYSANVGLESPDAEEEEERDEIGAGAITGMLLMSLVFAIGLFFLVPLFASRPLEGKFGNDLLSNVAEGLIRLGLFLTYVWLIGKMREIRRVFMYHGAEHMTVHAQEHGQPLVIESVRMYSPAHQRCGTAFLLTVMVVAIAVFAFVPREPFWWLITSRVVLIPAIAAVSYEIIRWSGRYASNPLISVITMPNLILQKLTTRPPEDDQIEVAIAAMKRAIEADGDADPPAGR